MADRLRWGIIGTGRIAAVFADQLPRSCRGHLQAVASRSFVRAEAFARAHGAPVAHGDYHALLADDTVDAVYIATPHPQHLPWVLAACAHGKHVLCEKPLAVNAPQAWAMIDTARRADVFLMEAYMYRCHPQIARLRHLLAVGRIGPIRHIEAVFAFRGGDDPTSRLLDPLQAGGSILDVGCYPLSFARLVAGWAIDRPCAEPESLVGSARLGATGVDDHACACLRFADGLTAQLTAGVRLGMPNAAVVYGDRGRCRLRQPWLPGSTAEIVLETHDGESTTLTCSCPEGLYACEADVVADHLDRRQAPVMGWEDSLGNMRALDRWRHAVGLTYPDEVEDLPEAIGALVPPERAADD